MNHRTRIDRRRRGAFIVEAALVLPVVFSFFFGIIEYGRFFMTVHAFNNAVCEGASYAAKHGDPIYLNNATYGSAASDVVGEVTSKLAGVRLANQSISVFLSDAVGNNVGAWTGAQPGQHVCVKATGTYNFFVTTLLGLPNSTPLTFSAVKRSEGN